MRKQGRDTRAAIAGRWVLKGPQEAKFEVGAYDLVSVDFPTTPCPFQTAHKGGGSNDAFVAKLNPVGSGLVYSTYLGAEGGEEGRGIAVDTTGNAYGFSYAS